MALIGILGGSFNPVHLGHTTLAKGIVDTKLIDKVWLTLSPQNPFKQTKTLIDDSHRLSMLKLAVNRLDNIEVCDAELTLPRPSYTINTLNYLSRLFPSDRFTLIIGADNWAVFERWKNNKEIIARFGVIVYPRDPYPMPHSDKHNVTAIDLPLLDISSTMIRTRIQNGLDCSSLLDNRVADYILQNKLYISSNNND